MSPSTAGGPGLRDAVRIAGEWYGGGRVASPAAEGVDQGIVPALAAFLYANWYAAAPDKPPGLSPVPLVESLRAAHRGSDTWESGWVAARVSTAGRVVAVRQHEQRMLSPGDYVSIGPGEVMPRVGAPLAVVSRWDSVTLLPGYWVTHSRDWFSARGTLARLYWNVQAAGAPALVRGLTGALGGVPFCLKIPGEVAGFARTDAAVLYVPAEAFPSLRGGLRTAHEALLEWLSPDTPPLTKPIAAGLGAAETRWNAAESFGQHRCRLIAQALVRAFQSATAGDADRLSAISDEFLREGLAPARPWLEPGGCDHYVL